jgi:CRP/FNR family cyclic AMP-dependent transcriptional regulator
VPTKRTKRLAPRGKRFLRAALPPRPAKSEKTSRKPFGLPAAGMDLNLRSGCQEFFSRLDAQARGSFAALVSVSAYPEGAWLFVEGQKSRGVFVVLEGKVKLSLTSREGKTLIWKLAGAGSFLGLAATVLEKPYEVTAETIEPCESAFIRREAFLGFLENNPQAWMNILRLLTDDHDLASKKLRALGGVSPLSARLAWLLMGKFGWDAKSNSGIIPMNLLTHQEIAEVIGTSRETVTRALGELKVSGLAAYRDWQFPQPIPAGHGNGKEP